MMWCESKKLPSFPSQKSPRVALIADSIVCSQTTAEAHGYGANASHGNGIPFQLPSYAGSNLYCLVTEATGCEKLALEGFL